MRALLIAALAFLALLFAPTATAALNQREVLREINKVRAAHNLVPVKANRKLHRATQRRSMNMARYRYFAHRHRLGLRWVSWKVVTPGCGEIIAWGYNAKQAVRAWLRSPAHKRVMLMKRWRVAGASFAKGHRLYLTVHFGLGC